MHWQLQTILMLLLLPTHTISDRRDIYRKLPGKLGSPFIPDALADIAVYDKASLRLNYTCQNQPGSRSTLTILFLRMSRCRVAVARCYRRFGGQSRECEEYHQDKGTREVAGTGYDQFSGPEIRKPDALLFDAETRTTVLVERSCFSPRW